MNNELLSKKTEIEKKIEMKVEENKKLDYKIVSTQKDTKKTSGEKNIEILEYKIQQQENDHNIIIYQYELARIDRKMITEEIDEKFKNGEMSREVRANEATNVKNYFLIYNDNYMLDSYWVINEKIEMQKRLLRMKRARGKITEEQYTDEMDKIIAEEEQNEREMGLGYVEEHTQSIAKDIRSYKINNLKYKKNKGIITEAEFNEQIANLEKDNGIDSKFIDSEYDRLLNVSGVKQEKQIERIETGRDKNSLGAYLGRILNQDINMEHDDSMSMYLEYVIDKIDGEYNFEFNNQMDYVDFIGEKLAEEYTRYEKGDKADIIRDFAKLEAKGLYEGASFDEAKCLLQFEKVDGIQYDYSDATYFQDDLYQQSPIHEVKEEVYIATYEKEQYDETTGRNVMVPIKEYYTKNEKSELVQIASSEDKEFEGIKVYVGKSLEKVSQIDMTDRLIKNTIEDSLKKGKVRDIAQITDRTFLEDLIKQCGLPEDYPIDKVFMATTINEKGEEEFNLVTGFPTFKNGQSITFKQFEGLDVASETGKEISTTSNIYLPGGAMELETVTTAKEFVTKSGNRYAITRNENGELGFSELPRENEKTSTARHIDTYQLVKTYENLEINEQDLSNARKTLERTKEERVQTKDYNEQEK